MTPDLRIQPSIKHVLLAELSPPDREALAGLLAATARAIADDQVLPSYLHLAAEHALTALGGGR